MPTAMPTASSTLQTTDPVRTDQPSPAEVRGAAERRFATPSDDDSELAHHLLSRYLTMSSADPAGSRIGSADLLASLGELFAAVADRRRLHADDPVLLALAAVLLRDHPAREGTRVAPAARPGVPRQPQWAA